jgi:hypothetical protein
MARQVKKMAARLAKLIAIITTCISGVSCRPLYAKNTATCATIEITDTTTMILQPNLLENDLPLITTLFVAAKLQKLE